VEAGGGHRISRLTQETGFEKPRGVSRVDVRAGFTQVHVQGLGEPMTESRISVLEAVSAVDVSIDFLKLTPAGLSFLVPEAQSEAVQKALAAFGFSLSRDRSIVLVHAVNMRDEEGLIAGIIQAAIASGARIDHVGDMHDRVLLVMDEADAERVANDFRTSLIGGVNAP
jgi:aspartate kinase